MPTDPEILSGTLYAPIAASGPAAPTLQFGDKPPLRLRSGMNNIEWAYELKTNVQSTYGGEVIQILGASVGPIRISGNTQSRQEYESIKRWIVEVMRALGTGNRRETPITFKYAERGWAFHIIPIEFGPWQLDDKLVATEWFLTAEVVSSTSNSLVEWTMAQHQIGMPNSSLLAPHAFDHWKNHFDPAFAQEYFPTLDDVEEQGNTVDRMLASLVRGAFDLFGRPEGATDEPDDVYEEIFGSKWLVPPKDDTAGAGYTGEPSTELQTVGLINSTFEDAGVPGRLGVFVALVESASTLDPSIINTLGYMGLFQTQSSGRGGGGPQQYRDEVKAAERAIAGKSIPSPWGFFPEIPENYPASSQIAHAAAWFADSAYGRGLDDVNDKEKMLNWVFDAQGLTQSPSDQENFRQAWARQWRRAGELIEQAEDVAAVAGGSTAIEGGVAKPVAATSVGDGLGAGRGHEGLDLPAPRGTPVYAVQAGTINVAHTGCAVGNRSCGGGWGNHVFLETSSGEWIYAHLTSVAVRQGQKVEMGQLLGTVGNTGHSFGDHLHIEWHPGGYKNVGDPMDVLGRFYG